MNLTAKMQSVAGGAQMVIGKMLYDKLSNESREIFEAVKLGKTRWSYYHSSAARKPYQLYILCF